MIMVIETDPLDEVRRIRKELTARFGNDVKALAEWLRETSNSHRLVDVKANPKPGVEPTPSPAELTT